MPTIAAIATPAGPGGIGIIRISGPEARKILDGIFVAASSSFSGFEPWKLHHGGILDRDGNPLDDGLAVFMPGPKTFTGEDIAEIHCHGGQLVVQYILESVLSRGARQAARGEFSKRAFINGRMDLSQAEAVAELIAAPGREALRHSLQRLSGHIGRRVRELTARIDDMRAHACVAVDFPEDEVPPLPVEEFIARSRAIVADLDSLLQNARRARPFDAGQKIALAGAVNTGKSSLLNALAGRRRALVSDIPGTTRDFLEVDLDFSGLPVRLVDTAGLRDSGQDELEARGMDLSQEVFADADMLWLVLDGGNTLDTGPDKVAARILEKARVPVLLVWNKSDLCMGKKRPDWLKKFHCCEVSALTGHNLEELVARSRAMLAGAPPDAGSGLAPNTRQALALEEARAELLEFERELSRGQTFDLCLARLDMAVDALNSITGLATHDELLNRIFSQFCIGK